MLALRALALGIRGTPTPALLESLAARAVDEAPAGTACAAVARGVYALVAAIRGRPFDVAAGDAAFEAIDAAIPLELSWTVRDSLVDLHLGLPDVDRCRNVLLSSLALGERHDSPVMIGTSTIALAWLEARCGNRTAIETAVHRVRTTLRPGGWDAVLAIDISLAMADGRLDDAEVLIHDASALVGPDSILTFLFDYQHGVLTHLRGASAATSGPPAPQPARFVNPRWEVARRSARNGDFATAIATLTSLMPHSVDELRKPLPIMNVLVAVAEAAGLVRDVDRAAMLIPALEPYAGQMAISLSASELKLPVSSVLGRLRTLTGDPDSGVADCEAGLALVDSMQTPLLTADASMVLADVLVLRGRDDDLVRAQELLADACDVSESCGAHGVADLARRLLDTARPS